MQKYSLPGIIYTFNYGFLILATFLLSIYNQSHAKPARNDTLSYPRIPPGQWQGSGRTSGKGGALQKMRAAKIAYRPPS